MPAWYASVCTLANGLCTDPAAWCGYFRSVFDTEQTPCRSRNNISVGFLVRLPVKAFGKDTGNVGEEIPEAANKHNQEND